AGRGAAHGARPRGAGGWAGQALGTIAAEAAAGGGAGDHAVREAAASGAAELRAADRAAVGAGARTDRVARVEPCVREGGGADDLVHGAGQGQAEHGRSDETELRP